ncbi:MAG: hypothetical protein HY619_04100 [Thaumarchaeota archaeon]|nr:hypothetical protein [Nitrososphaerota archaeon]
MPQLKVVCLAHPATWAGSGNPEETQRKFLSLKPSSASWVNLKEQRGKRVGIYNVGSLTRKGFAYALMVDESEVNPEHKSLERILQEDGCLTDTVEVQQPVPRASKAVLVFDFADGLCYVYTPGTPTPEESVVDVVRKVGRDIGIPCRGPKVFEWSEDFAVEMTDVARSRGFSPYRVRADLETVKVTAEGDLMNNPDWKKLEGALESDKWSALAYVRSKEEGMFVFGLTKKRRRTISLPLGENFEPEQVLHTAIEMREMLERTLGQDIRQCLFPEPITTLTNFKSVDHKGMQQR